VGVEAGKEVGVGGISEAAGDVGAGSDDDDELQAPSKIITAPKTSNPADSRVIEFPWNT